MVVQLREHKGHINCASFILLDLIWLWDSL